MIPSICPPNTQIVVPFALAYWLIYALAVPLGVWPALGLALLSILLWVGALYWRGMRRR